jgi:Glycine-zipper domain
MACDGCSTLSTGIKLSKGYSGTKSLAYANSVFGVPGPCRINMDLVSCVWARTYRSSSLYGNGGMNRRKSFGWTSIGLAALGAIALATPGHAQSLIIYPAKGQSPAQQDRDRYACHTWAVQQSGYDPSFATSQPAPYGATPLRGAARGATIGAVGGAIGGNAGKGAAIGAASGALIGGIRRRDQYRQQQSSASQQRSLYNRALGTCMQGRGYTVG